MRKSASCSTSPSSKAPWPLLSYLKPTRALNWRPSCFNKAPWFSITLRAPPRSRFLRNRPRRLHVLSMLMLAQAKKIFIWKRSRTSWSRNFLPIPGNVRRCPEAHATRDPEQFTGQGVDPDRGREACRREFKHDAEEPGRSPKWQRLHL